MSPASIHSNKNECKLLLKNQSSLWLAKITCSWSSAQLVILHLNGGSNSSSSRLKAGTGTGAALWGFLDTATDWCCGSWLLGSATLGQPTRDIWSSICLQTIIVHHFGLWLGPFLDVVEDITHPFHDQTGIIEALHQLGADAFHLLGAVQSNCIPSVVPMLIYGAVIIVLLLAIPPHLQMLAGELVYLFHFLTLFGSTHRLSSILVGSACPVNKSSGSSTLQPNISFGKKPIDSFTEESWGIISRGWYRSQTFWFSSTNFESMASRVLLNSSTLPSDCSRKGLVLVWSISRILHISWKNLDSKFRSQSV